MNRASARTRADRHALTTLLLAALILTAAMSSALAGSSPPAEARGEALAAGEVPAPGAAEFAAAEAEGAEELRESPQAEAERAASRTAYADVSEGEAKELLVEDFPEALASLNDDPGRVLSGLEILKPLGPDAAVVHEEGGGRSLVESSVPVES